MTSYFHEVVLPAVREEFRRKDVSASSLSLRLRLALADGGRWLMPMITHVSISGLRHAHACVRFVSSAHGSPSFSINAVTTSGIDGCVQWARSAEACGIGPLRKFAETLLAKADNASDPERG